MSDVGTRVEITRRARKDLESCPVQAQKKFRLWVTAVELVGVHHVRKTSSYHDEPLAGDRQGQRSIRLNDAYRAFYKLKRDDSIEFISVVEVNKHRY